MPDTPEELAARQRTLQLNSAKRTTPPPPKPTVSQNGLDTILNDPGAQWSFSGSGTGGAVLVQPGPNMGGTGAAIKMEHIALVTNAQKCGQLLDGFLQNAQGPPPFSAPRTKIYQASDLATDNTLLPGLNGKMTALGNDPNFVEDRRDKLDDRQADLAQVPGGNSAILVMEFANGTQANRLPPDDKVALLRGEAFAKAIGRSMAPSMALGLTDHSGTSAGGAGFKFNISNYMYEPKTGELSVIDYDSGVDNVDRTNPNSAWKVGKVNNDTAQELGNMRTFLENAVKSPAAFESAIDQMLKDKGKTPFNAAMKSFTETGKDSFFPDEEDASCVALTMEDKRRLAANILVGAIDGMEYLQQNKQVLETAVKNTHEVVNGVKVEHFHNKQELDAMGQEIDKIDAPTMKQGAQTCLDAMHNKRKVEMQTFHTNLDTKENDINQRLVAAQAKLDRVTQHPTAGQRLKAAFSDADHSPKQKATAEVQKLQKELALVKDLRDGADSRQAFLDQVDGQSKLAPPKPKIAASKVGDVIKMKINGPQPKQQGQAQDNNAPKQGTDQPPRPKLTPAQELQNKIDADKSGVNRVRAKPRVRETAPEVVHTENQGQQQKLGGPKAGKLGS